MCTEEGVCGWVSDCRVGSIMIFYESIVTRGAALQSAGAILSSLFRVLPHEIDEADPFSAKMSCAGSESFAGGEYSTDAVITPTSPPLVW